MVHGGINPFRPQIIPRAKTDRNLRLVYGWLSSECVYTNFLMAIAALDSEAGQVPLPPAFGVP